VAVVSLLLLVLGCGPKGPKVVPVTGRVTKDDSPVSNVLIHFWPERGRPSSARTDDDGRFELVFSKEIPKGAVPGKHKVYFTLEQASIDEKIDINSSKYHPEMRKILKKYGNYQTTPLKIEVKKGEPIIDIKLD